MTAPVARYCRRCAGTDATPDVVLVVKGTCERCGRPDQVLYRVVPRPLPGTPGGCKVIEFR